MEVVAEKRLFLANEENSRNNYAPSYRQITIFRIISSFKGRIPGKLAVESGRLSASCGVTFKTNNLYLVFAYKNENGGLGTSLCSSFLIDRENSTTTGILNELVNLRGR